MAPRPPAMKPGPTDTPQPGERRNHEAWPSENMKSDTQLGYIKTTKGMFGHGIAGANSRSFGSVDNNCAGDEPDRRPGARNTSSPSWRAPIAFGTDWNALLGGRVRGSGRWPGSGSKASWSRRTTGRPWSASQRLAGSLGQGHGVRYTDRPRDWRCYRFRDTKPRTPRCSTRTWRWGTRAASCGRGWSSASSGANLDDAKLVAPLREPALGYAPALEYARALAGKISLVTTAGPNGSDYHRAAIVAPGRTRWPARTATCRASCSGSRSSSTSGTRCSSGPAPPLQRWTGRPGPRVRLQPRRPRPLRDAAGHAPGPEERPAAARHPGPPVPVCGGVPPGLGTQREGGGDDPAPGARGGSLMPAWYVHIQAAAETMERLNAGVPAGLAAHAGAGERLFTAAHNHRNYLAAGALGPGPVLPPARLQGRPGQGPPRARRVRAHDLEGARRDVPRAVGNVDGAGGRQPQPAGEQPDRRDARRDQPGPEPAHRQPRELRARAWRSR